MYSTESLERGIEDIKKNIKVFEEAIAKERARIDEYYGMIDALKLKQREEELGQAGVIINLEEE